MLVYGDQHRTVRTSDVLDHICRAATELTITAPGVRWHHACVAIFITIAELLQGVADSEFAVTDQDERSPTQMGLMTVLRTMAGAIDQSMSSGFTMQVPPDVLGLYALARTMPPIVTIRRYEGYAFYAVYPELYLMAARDVPKGACVIGLRSIGTGLAAAVASTCAADFCCTLRPIGPPYARHVAVGPDLEAEIKIRRHGTFALVDEGPGQSGSSFGGVADYLERLGVARDHILFLPSHAGDLGPNAAPSHRRRWRETTRLTRTIDDMFLGAGPAGLPGWFEDVTGPSTAPLRDVSGGAWRSASSCPDAPADPGRERRKFLLTTSSGTFLLKFAGLDAVGRDAFVTAKRLYEAGFTPEPLALRHGFLVERWVETDAAPDLASIWPVVRRYLEFRAGNFPVAAAGASLPELVEMARHNIGEAYGSLADSVFAAWPHDRVAALTPLVRPVWIDGRMQRWEWIHTSSGVLKTDAIDHAHGHDLVGCQDIAWDVAGAIVELEATRQQGTTLIRSVMSGRPEAEDLTDLMTLCYIGFQIGWWHFATEPESADRQRAFYRRKITDLLSVRHD
jgi:hypothetical protein